ncbi:TetR family transcriptional regulator [Sediminihabitans luteus]|uniref:TetR family transcriptional regulator n=1 Tax=Sediminihabitans luteus TaxID=1138585 RepID=A0A2M9D0Q4_9CELL|nr:TetR/AcrR family transcriptional regulator [Sediminihabitans luteus]PJJ77749.1 TetR family transcriptional regulator [Sediminihabitans luteus]GIJ00024.1 hypothetical protein Slu03_24010 [Sediminihabitans luteus]
MPSSTPASPPDRDAAALPGRQREARANDTAILVAARAVFAAQGHGAAMSDVAREAGVGVGSVYRRYPTKEALVEALHTHGVQEAARLARRVADEVAPGAVVRFVACQISTATGPLLRPTGATTPIPPDLARASDELHEALETLVAQDVRAGVVPAGLTAADVMQLLLHLRPTLPLPRAQADALHLRYLDLVDAGMRAQASAGVVLEGGPAWDEWVGTWHD